VAVGEYVGGQPSRRQIRPKQVTTAGVLLIVPSAICLLIWSVLVAIGLVVDSALANMDSDNGGLHLATRFYLVVVLPSCFWAMAIVVGILVLRGTSWARVPAVVVAVLAVLADAAGAVGVIRLADGLSEQYLVIGLAYLAVNCRLLYVLMSAEVGTWCRRR
jgi:hypothetical protein